MKNILSRLGTKKVAGVVLAGATLLVGLGVVNNFSGNSQKAANEAALSRFGESSYSSSFGGSSASRADIERQMSATQAGYGARFLKGQSEGVENDEALSSDGAYAEGIRGGARGVYGPGRAGANGAYSEGGVYNPINSTYEQVSDGPEFAGYDGKGSGYGDAQFQAAEAAAAAAAKNAKGKGGKGEQGSAAEGKGVRNSTQINKLSASSGGSSFGNGGAGSGMGGGMYGGSSSLGGSDAKGGDNNSQVLPNITVGQTPDGNAFKFGRAGGMGGFSASFNGRESRDGHNRGYGATSDMQLAAAYSKKGAASNSDVGKKSLAEAAFDGSNPEDIAPTIPEGASIGQVSSTLMKGTNLDLPDGESLIPPEVEDTMKETLEQQKELLALQKKISNRLLWLIGGVLAAAIGIAVLVSISNPYTYIAAAVLSVIALAFIAIMLWAGDNSIINLIKEMGNDDRFGLVNQGIDVNSKLQSTYILSGKLVLVLGAGWIPWGGLGSSATWVQMLASAAAGIVGDVLKNNLLNEAVNNSNIGKQRGSAEEQLKELEKNEKKQ